MKLRRLYQPANPQFWLVVVLNLLSAALAWITHHYTLELAASVVLVAFALGNAALGAMLMWRLANS
jgi:hypothetical protein